MAFKLERKKKTSEGIKDVIETSSTELINYKSQFNFKEFGIEEKEDVNYFIDQEKKVLHLGKRFNEVIYDIGEVLVEVKERFKRHSERGFQAWYENLGIHKDLVSVATKRYYLYLENPEKKEIVYSMSSAALKQVTNKKTPEEIKEKVLRGELKTAKEILEAKKQFSPTRENKILKEQKELIEEAEVVEIEENLLEKREEKIKRVVDKVYILLTRATGDENIKQFQDEELEIFEKNIDELNKILDNYEPL